MREQLRIQDITLFSPEEAMELIEQEGLTDMPMMPVADPFAGTVEETDGDAVQSNEDEEITAE